MRQVRTRRPHLFTLIAVLVACVGFAGPASAQTSVPPGAAPVPGPQAVVPPSAAKADGSVDVGATVQVGGEVKVEQFRAPSVRDADALVAQLRRTPGVTAAEPKIRMHVLAVGPDPYRLQQWALDRVPFAKASALVNPSALAQQVVAVIDTGVNAAHEDLVDRLVGGADCLTGTCLSGGAYGRTDPNGHGTLVASVVGASTGNALGIAGAATGAPILSVRAMDANGVGSNFTISAAINYAALHGARVINMSLSGDPDEQSALVSNAVADAINNHGITVVAAAGNNGDTQFASDPVYPANDIGVIAATSTDPDDSRSWFSNYGSWLDGKGLSAPGVQICGAHASGGYLAESGTSLSSPLVAAAAALTRAAGAAPDAVYPTLLNEAQPIGGSFANLVNAPLVNPRRAVQAALGQIPSPYQPGGADLPDSGGGYTLDGWGALHSFAVGCNLAPDDPRGLTTWPGWDIARGVSVISRQAGGYTLDGFGGLHMFRIGSFGSTPPDTSGATYWPGWDIARSIAVMPNATPGSRGGYTLDGFGGLHIFRIAGGSNPPGTFGAPYWPGWDIARGIAVLPDGTGGYVLDGWGGLHAFKIGQGGAGPAPPAIHGAPYWQGWDVARAVVLLPDGTGGYTLDAFGGLHPFSLGNNQRAFQVNDAPYWPGWGIARGAAATL
jgi:thermitase